MLFSFFSFYDHTIKKVAVTPTLIKMA